MSSFEQLTHYNYNEIRKIYSTNWSTSEDPITEAINTIYKLKELREDEMYIAYLVFTLNNDLI